MNLKNKVPSIPKTAVFNASHNKLTSLEGRPELSTKLAEVMTNAFFSLTNEEKGVVAEVFKLSQK
jgi:hypothetical protein